MLQQRQDLLYEGRGNVEARRTDTPKDGKHKVTLSRN